MYCQEVARAIRYRGPDSKVVAVGILIITQVLNCFYSFCSFYFYIFLLQQITNNVKQHKISKRIAINQHAKHANSNNNLCCLFIYLFEFKRLKWRRNNVLTCRLGYVWIHTKSTLSMHPINPSRQMTLKRRCMDVVTMSKRWNDVVKTFFWRRWPAGRLIFVTDFFPTNFSFFLILLFFRF